jgi:hypothetical protein
MNQMFYADKDAVDVDQDQDLAVEGDDVSNQPPDASVPMEVEEEPSASTCKLF